jgi:hypothetical protein
MIGTVKHNSGTLHCDAMHMYAHRQASSAQYIHLDQYIVSIIAQNNQRIFTVTWMNESESNPSQSRASQSVQDKCKKGSGFLLRKKKTVTDG